jgi:hypothetical protein
MSASVDVLGYVGRVRGYEGGYNQLPAVLLPGSEQSTVNLWILWLPILFELVLLPSVPVIPATVPDRQKQRNTLYSLVESGEGGRVVVVVVVVLEADLSEAEDHQRQARGASYKAEETRANSESRYWGARARLPRNRGERCH